MASEQYIKGLGREKQNMYMEKVNWPDGKRCAVMITVNLNAELFWLQLDSNCVNMPKTLSMGQYGMTRGLERVLDTLREHKIKATFFTPGKVAELYPAEMRCIFEEGHEIAASSYENENLALLCANEQEASIKKSMEAIEKSCGAMPRGFRAPAGELTLETLQAAQKLGIRYSSNLSDDDRPYPKEIGSGTPMMEIPIHWALYDLPYFAFNYKPAFPKGQGRIANYTGVLNNWKDEFYGYYHYGLCYVLQIDPQTIGNPGRIGILEELLDYMGKFEGLWFATGAQMEAFMAPSCI